VSWMSFNIHDIIDKEGNRTRLISGSGLIYFIIE